MRLFVYFQFDALNINKSPQILPVCQEDSVSIKCASLSSLNHLANQVIVVLPYAVDGEIKVKSNKKPSTRNIGNSHHIARILAKGSQTCASSRII